MTKRMPRASTPPLASFVDALPVPPRLIAAEHNGRLTVRQRAGEHRFHRDLPTSRIWGYDGNLPGPTVETERGQPVTVEWRNELDGRLRGCIGCVAEGGRFELPIPVRV